MFNVLFGWSKASKCKKLIKRVQCRLKLLKNKRICIVKQLKKDVADLLNHGHHQTAFQRVEQVVIDETMVEVYDLLYQFCEFVIINLPYIRKHRDCPNDIKEAVSSLIFSSARFGELPELLSIRDLFSHRYGHKFVATALEPNLINTQIVEGLEMKSVPNDVKHKFLDDIAATCIQTEPLFLEYKPQLQEEYEIDGRRERESDKKFLHEDKFLWRDLSFGSRKEGDFRNEIDTYSENSANLGEEVIYLDDVEEFMSPVIKEGGLQDQRFFVFRSFGSKNGDKTESRNPRRKRSRKRSLVRRTSAAAHNEFAAYYDESDDDEDMSPQIRRKSHHQRVRSSIFSQPQPRFFSVNGAEEAEEFSSRHLEKDGAKGKLTLPSATRAITMPCERTRDGNATETENINRSNSYPFSPSYDEYSPCHHIHPKLPDYDELAAKFMELKRANIEKKLDIKI